MAEEGNSQSKADANGKSILLICPPCDPNGVFERSQA
jgi:hypothetical protein